MFFSWISSSGNTPAAARLRHAGHEARELEDLFGALGRRQLLEVPPPGGALSHALRSPIPLPSSPFHGDIVPPPPRILRRPQRVYLPRTAADRPGADSVLPMPQFSVRFKGLLMKSQRIRLEAAGIAHQSSEPSMRIAMIKTGPPIHTVAVEAASAEQALATVREALEPDSSTFSNWEAVT